MNALVGTLIFLVIVSIILNLFEMFLDLFVGIYHKIFGDENGYWY